MKYFALLYAGVWRRPVRAVLLLLAIGSGFFLIGVLKAFVTVTDDSTDTVSADRFFVSSRMSQYVSLPYAHLGKIRAIQGVAAATHGVVFAAQYRTPKQIVVAFAVDPPSFFAVYRDWHIPAGDLERMRATRTGILVSRTLALRYGWSQGDRLPLERSNWRQANGSSAWTFDIVGVFEPADETSMVALVNYDYLDGARVSERGRVGAFTIRTSPGADTTRVVRGVDLLFENSADETRTLSEQEFAHQQIQQIGDIEFVVTAIVAAALFSMLLCVAAVQLQSFHERRRSFATLIALGVQSRTIGILLFLECMIFSCGGAAIGLGAAVVAIHASSQLIGISAISAEACIFTASAATVLAILSAAAPASMAVSLNPQAVFAKT